MSGPPAAGLVKGRPKSGEKKNHSFKIDISIGNAILSETSFVNLISAS
jgi:hypothetical protein